MRPPSRVRHAVHGGQRLPAPAPVTVALHPGGPTCGAHLVARGGREAARAGRTRAPRAAQCALRAARLLSTATCDLSWCDSRRRAAAAAAQHCRRRCQSAAARCKHPLQLGLFSAHCPSCIAEGSGLLTPRNALANARWVACLAASAAALPHPHSRAAATDMVAKALQRTLAGGLHRPGLGAAPAAAP